MFWHFDQLQFWSYYTHEGVNYGGEFGLKIFSRNSTLLCDAVENLKSEWLSGVNRKHWGEQHSKYPICMVKTLSSKTFDWEIRCPDNLRFHKIGRHFVISKYILLQTAHFLPHVPKEHKCRRLHGHNFGLWISIEVSNFDDKTHDTINCLELSCQEIQAKLDQCILNDIEGLRNPTSENIALWVFQKLTLQLHKVFNILCIETTTSAACYHGNDLWSCWKSFDFESVWRPSVDRIFGHSFKLTAGVQGELVPPFGWVLDFSEIKSHIKPLIDQIDHQDLSRILNGRGNCSEGLLEWLSEQSPSKHEYELCLQSLPSKGTYRNVSELQLSGAVPYVDWRI